MANKIIQLSEVRNFEEYNKILAAIITKLKGLDGYILDSCLKLALSGEWKQWSDEQPVGTIFSFNEAMLRKTNDENINTLLHLADYIAALQRELKPKPLFSPKKSTKRTAKNGKGRKGLQRIP